MSYQIKSTPFFQRMLKTCQLNGQLQMLKEEYERMHFFDDRNLEKKVKEVRLKRLFREVEEIRESDSKRIKLEPKTKPRTKESERIQNLKKAKSLGQYYSQRNCENVRAVLSNDILDDKRKTLTQPKSNPESGIKKGIKYGNEISDWNMQRIKQNNFRKEFAQERTKKQEKESNKSSNHNKKESKINQNYPYQPEDNSSVISLGGGNVQLIDLERIDDNVFKSCTEIHDAILIDKANIQLMLSCSSSENIRTNRAAELWQKAFALSKRHILQNEAIKTLQFLNSKKPNPNISQYPLQSISKGNNLPKTNFNPYRTDRFHKHLNEANGEYEGERFANAEYLFGSFSSRLLDDEMPRYPPPPPSPPPITIPMFTDKKYPFHLNGKPSEDNVNNSNENKKKKKTLK